MRTLSIAIAVALLTMAAVAPAQQAPMGPAANPKVIMLRLYVSDLARGEKFYHEVFGTTVVQKMGDNVRIMTFPGGALPGIIMIKSPEETQMNGSFVIQVPDMEAALARAAANGGKPLATRFSQDVQNMPAQSRHVIDPDGNDIEVMQVGKAN